MATPEAVLIAEGETLAAHLLGEAPDPAVVERYAAWHATPAGRGTDVEDALVRAARRGGFSLRMADAFASRFRRAGALRRKLVLMLALAECSPRNAARLDRAGGRSVPVTLLVMAWVGFTEVIVLLAAIVRFGLFAGERRS